MAQRQVNLRLNLQPGSPQPILNLFRSLVPVSAATGQQIGRNLAQGFAHLRPATAAGAGGPGGGGIGSTLAGAAGGLVGGGVGLAVAAVSGVVGAAVALGETIKDTALATVSKASPATMARMNQAWDDLLAVIDRSLVPVVELLTDSFRLLGGFLAGILPSAAEFRAALQPLRDFFEELRPVLAEIASVLKEVLKVGLKALAEALRLVLTPLRWLIGLAKQLGLLSGEQKLPSSVGAAARPASIHTDAISFAQQTYGKILSSFGGGSSPEERQAQAAEEAVDLLQEIRDKLAKSDSPEGNLSARVEDAAKLGLGRYS